MKYRVNGALTVSVSVTVEADSEEQARELAKEWIVTDLCIQCSGANSDQFGDPSDPDNLPFSLDTDGVPQWDDVEVAR